MVGGVVVAVEFFHQMRQAVVVVDEDVVGGAEASEVAEHEHGVVAVDVGGEGAAPLGVTVFVHPVGGVEVLRSHPVVEGGQQSLEDAVFGVAVGRGGHLLVFVGVVVLAVGAVALGEAVVGVACRVATGHFVNGFVYGGVGVFDVAVVGSCEPSKDVGGAVGGGLVALKAAVAVLHEALVLTHEAADVLAAVHGIGFGELGVREAIDKAVVGFELAHEAAHIVGFTVKLGHGHRGVDEDVRIAVGHGLADEAAHVGFRRIANADVKSAAGFGTGEHGFARHLAGDAAHIVADVALVGEELGFVHEHVFHHGAVGQCAEQAVLLDTRQEAAVEAPDDVALAVKLAFKMVVVVVHIDGGG